MIPEGKIRLPLPPILIDEELAAKKIYVFVGMNLYAWLTHERKWVIRTGDCTMCGECCRRIEGRHPWKVVDGVCEHLNEDGLCGLGVNRPWGCCITTDFSEVPECPLTFEEI
jgi:hypothetical protein